MYYHFNIYKKYLNFFLSNYILINHPNHQLSPIKSTMVKIFFKMLAKLDIYFLLKSYSTVGGGEFPSRHPS
jgi:hypothetical protein